MTGAIYLMCGVFFGVRFNTQGNEQSGFYFGQNKFKYIKVNASKDMHFGMNSNKSDWCDNYSVLV